MKVSLILPLILALSACGTDNSGGSSDEECGLACEDPNPPEVTTKDSPEPDEPEVETEDKTEDKTEDNSVPTPEPKPEFDMGLYYERLDWQAARVKERDLLESIIVGDNINDLPGAVYDAFWDNVEFAGTNEVYEYKVWFLDGPYIYTPDESGFMYSTTIYTEYDGTIISIPGSFSDYTDTEWFHLSKKANGIWLERCKKVPESPTCVAPKHLSF